MGFASGKRRLAGFGAVLATALLLGTADRARAEDPNINSGVTVDQPGAILIFPKVVFSKGRDTLIQLSNTMNVTAQARCFYIDARLQFPDQPPGPFNPRAWSETDFTLFLTRQQPTHWVASFGRPVDPSDGLGEQNSGIDPGGIPPVTAGFEGELRCVVVDAGENPIPANWLKGEATIRSLSGDVSNYNAIAIRAGERAGETGNTLILDEVGKDTGGQYNSCPDTLLFNFVKYDSPDPVIQQNGLCASDNCPIETSLTLVPCRADFENQIGGQVTVHFDITDEFETTLSEVTTVQCWYDTDLNRIGPGGAPTNNSFVTLASPTGLARITPADGQGGVLGIAEETHIDSDKNQARAAFNLQHEGSRAASLPFENFDRIVLSAPF